MKTKTLLIYSIILNVALGLMSLRSAFPSPEIRSIGAGRADTVNSTNHVRHMSEQGRLVGEKQFRDLHWSQIESPDYRKYIASLRAIGCPEETIRGLIILEINKRYAPRLAALTQQTNLFAIRHAGDPKNLERDEKLRALKQEKTQLLEELFGIGCCDEELVISGHPDLRDGLLGFIPGSKRRALRDLEGRYEQLQQQVYWKSHGYWLYEDELEVKALRARQREELNKLLTPEELTQYDLRMSPLAHSLQARLQVFHPTEEEFEKIFAVMQPFENDIDRGASAAQDQINSQLRSGLEAERFTEYQLSQNPAFVEFARFAQRFDLPQETARTLFDMKNVVEAQHRQVLGDQTLSEQERTAALKNLGTETQKALTGFLGDELFKLFRGHSQVWWQVAGINPLTGK
ncbi:MAG: hypothetical protein L0Z50_05155 [Verrucomicrobiales bacterium]|nr:hypothetical protein [Verrucomicrobiales bacterium]